MAQYIISRWKRLLYLVLTILTGGTYADNANAAYRSFVVSKSTTGTCSFCGNVCSAYMRECANTYFYRGFSKSDGGNWVDNGDGTCTCRFYCNNSAGTDTSYISSDSRYGWSCYRSVDCGTGKYPVKSHSAGDSFSGGYGTYYQCSACPAFEEGELKSGSEFVSGQAKNKYSCALASYSLWQDNIGVFQFTDKCEYGIS